LPSYCPPESGSLTLPAFTSVLIFILVFSFLEILIEVECGEEYSMVYPWTRRAGRCRRVARFHVRFYFHCCISFLEKLIAARDATLVVKSPNRAGYGYRANIFSANGVPTGAESGMAGEILFQFLH
jgi:hypothetical protein